MRIRRARRMAFLAVISLLVGVAIPIGLTRAQTAPAIGLSLDAVLKPYLASHGLGDPDAATLAPAIHCAWRIEPKESHENTAAAGN